MVRRAVAGDLAGVARVGQEAWPATYLSFAGQEYVEENLAAWWSPAALEQALESLLLVAVTPDDEVAGCLEIGELDGRPVMWKLYVRPAWQGQHIGSELLRAAVDQLSAPVLLTEYIAQNEVAGRWYAARGFRELRREARPRGLDVVWLQLDLARYRSSRG